MSDNDNKERDPLIILARAVDKLDSSVKKLGDQIKKFDQLIYELTVTVKTMPLVQLCRDQERDIHVLNLIMELMQMSLTEHLNSLSRVKSHAIEELKRVDAQLEENLRDLLLPVLEFKKEVRSLNDLTQLFNKTLNDMVASIYELYKAREGEVLNLLNQIKNQVNAIMNETDQIKESLKDYSMESLSSKPVIIGIPVVRVAVEGSKKQVYLGKGFEKYELKILEAVSGTEVGIQQEILDFSIEKIRQRKGTLYRLFLKKVKTMGETS